MIIFKVLTHRRHAVTPSHHSVVTPLRRPVTLRRRLRRNS